MAGGRFSGRGLLHWLYGMMRTGFCQSPPVQSIRENIFSNSLDIDAASRFMLRLCRTGRQIPRMLQRQSPDFAGIGRNYGVHHTQACADGGHQLAHAAPLRQHRPAAPGWGQRIGIPGVYAARGDLLQQILFYRELGMGLSVSRAYCTTRPLTARGRSAATSGAHGRAARLDALIANVRRTLDEQRGGKNMSDKEKFEGFKRGLIEETKRNTRGVPPEIRRQDRG